MNWKRRNITIVIIVAAAVLVLSVALAMWKQSLGIAFE